jgi:hypothetical protein
MELCSVPYYLPVGNERDLFTPVDVLAFPGVGRGYDFHAYQRISGDDVGA